MTTNEGGTATVEPKTSPSAATSELFDAAATCAVTPELTEGPYYFDVDSIRSDITEDREGTALRLRAARARRALRADRERRRRHLALRRARRLLGLRVGRRATYLRGAQVTNRDGVVEFRTIYPGWYRGRTVHIHAKVHLDSRTC